MSLDLYVLTGAVHCRTLSAERAAEEALEGGVTAIQMREKGLSDKEMLAMAHRIRALTRKYGAWFLINDRPDIAWLSRADGVHLGQDDLPPAEVRRLLGSESIIGLSVDTLEEALEAEAQGVSYIGLGPMAPTGTKPDAGPQVPLDLLTQVSRSVRVPVVAVGGIGLHNARELVAAGAGGIAVVSAVVCAPDVREAARSLRQEVEAGKALRIREKGTERQ